MTDDAETEDEGLEVDYTPPEPVRLDTPEGAFIVPCMDTLAEVLGETPAILWATDKGLSWLTSQRRWENVEASHAAKVASIRKQ